MMDVASAGAGVSGGAGMSPTGVRFNTLTDQWRLKEIMRYTDIPLHELQTKLKAKLGVELIAHLNPEARKKMLRKKEESFMFRKGSFRQPSSSSPTLARASTTTVAMASKASSLGFGKWQPRMMLNAHNDGWESIIGFYILEDTLAQSGYRSHLRARSKLGHALLEPSFTDLMMWAVLLGNKELARMLWRKTHEPMRAAIMARRLCYKMTNMCGPAFSDELQSAADEFENWAIGILDQITRSEDAFDMLTCAPMRKEDGTRPESVAGKWTKLWPFSVLDEAASEPYPCRRFVAHRHCQYVLDQYLVGKYRGSVAAVPPHSSVISIALQTIFQLLHPLFFGFWPVEAVSVQMPLFSVLAKDAVGDARADEKEFENDEFDEDYFEDDVKARDGKEASALMRWASYFTIPLVKFVNHAILTLAAILILIFTLMDPAQGLQQNAQGMYTTPDGMPPQEYLFWVICLGRLAEEVGQIIACGSLRDYMSSLWNKLDVLIIVLNITAFVLRIVVINYPDLESNDTGPNSEYQRLYMTQALYMDVQLWALLAFILRYFEFLAYSQSLGEVRPPPT